MTPQARWYVFFGTFLVCWLLYFFSPFVTENLPLLGFPDIIQNQMYEFLLAIGSFFAIAVAVTFSVHGVCSSIRRLKWFQPKIGLELVRRGFITQAELEEALGEQKLRTGEILVASGRISMEQMEDALRYQKNHKGKKIGEILIEKGYATDQDIFWALQKMRRKIGEILIDRGVITPVELKIIMAECGMSVTEDVGTHYLKSPLDRRG